jgi:hypothetical protein
VEEAVPDSLAELADFSGRLFPIGCLPLSAGEPFAKIAGRRSGKEGNPTAVRKPAILSA